MNNRINLLLQAKNITAKQFAEEIGVQPSGMSHIMSGRNNPSLDFVMKVVKRYPEVNIYWLMFGKGEMYDTGGASSTMVGATKTEAVANNGTATHASSADATYVSAAADRATGGSQQVQSDSSLGAQETTPYNNISADPKSGVNMRGAQAGPASNAMDLFSVQGLSPDGEPNVAATVRADIGGIDQESIRPTSVGNQQSDLVGLSNIVTNESGRMVSEQNALLSNNNVDARPNPILEGDIVSAYAQHVSPMGANRNELDRRQGAQVENVTGKSAFSTPISISQQILPTENGLSVDANNAGIQNAVTNGMASNGTVVVPENPMVGAHQANGTDRKKRIVKFIVLYDDHSFSEYYPEG